MFWVESDIEEEPGVKMLTLHLNVTVPLKVMSLNSPVYLKKGRCAIIC